MTPVELPAEVLHLVHGPVRTIAHVELLLALRDRAPSPVLLETLAEVAHVSSRDGARAMLDELANAGLVASPDPATWVFAPRGALREAVEALAAAYNQRPVTLVRALYERPAKPLQSFADAFRFRKHD